MRLLVSVSDAEETAAALAGGADVIDAKDPSVGSLGAVSSDTFHAIGATVAGARPLSAALGDARDTHSIERATHAAATAGATFVKFGFAGLADAADLRSLVAAAVRSVPTVGARPCGVVAVAYADWGRAGAPDPRAVIEAAVGAGAFGVLMDTAGKSGPGLRGLLSPSALAAWVHEAREAGLVVALAGQLTASDIPFIADLGADVVGMRGAACDGGRRGRVSAAKVRFLASLLASQLRDVAGRV